MTFEATALAGVLRLCPERRADERGFFARTWDREAFEARGLATDLSETAVSWNARRGTLRGMHHQVAPCEEAKVVSCLRGAVHDVMVDLRPGSPTFRRWVAARLDAAGMEALYAPPGVAHGFLTLEDDTLVQYQISGRYSPVHARGVRWDDPVLAIAWPEPPSVINARDAGWPLLEPKGT